MAYQIAPESRTGYRVVVFLAAFIAALLFAWMAECSPRGAPEMVAEDSLMRIAPGVVRPDVLLVAMDAATTAKYGDPSAISRSSLAQVLGDIEAGGPKLVVIDLPLDKRTDTGDAGLWRQMANHRNVVLGMAYDADRQPPYTLDDIRAWRFLEKDAYTSAITFGPQTQSFPFIDFEAPVSDFTGSAAGVGVFDRETDPDGVIRDARLFYLSTTQSPVPMPELPTGFMPAPLPDGTAVALPNIALTAAQQIFNLDKGFVVIHARRSVDLSGSLSPSVDPPVDKQGKMQIRFAGPAGTFSSVSYIDVASGKVKPPSFHKDVVLIGATDPKSKATDLALTPFGAMPRVEVTANAIATFMNRSYYLLLATLPDSTFWVLIAVGIVCGVTMMFFSGWRGLAASVLLLLIYLGICWIAFNEGAVMLPILPGVLTIAVTYVVSLLLRIGPFRPIPVAVSPTYVDPSEPRIE